MPDSSNQSSKSAANQADFRIALVFLLASLVLMAVTFTYPMTGDYGGVESQWYVSPAFFPMSLLGLLVVCSIYILVVSTRSGGHKGISRLSTWVGHHSSAVTRDQWAVIFCLAVYIYSWIPAMDFYWATSLFLFTLMSRFYLKNRRIETCSWLVVTVLVFAISTMRWLTPEENGLIPARPASDLRFVQWSDSLACIGLTIMCINLVLTRDISLSAKRAVFINALLLPLVLIVFFTFFLQVPMPQDNGMVIRLMEYLWYDAF